MSEEIVNVNEMKVSSYPSDGYFVEEYEPKLRKGTIQLMLSLRRKGEVRQVQTIQEWQDPDEEALGERRRLFWLWKAICHFLNSGGHLDLAIDRIIDTDPFSGLLLAALPLPPGYFLYDTDQEVEIDGEVHTQHVFVNRQTKTAIHWVEGVSYTVQPLSEVLEWVGAPRREICVEEDAGGQDDG